MVNTEEVREEERCITFKSATLWTKNNNDTVTLKNMTTIFTHVHLRLNCLALTIVAAVKHF